MRSLFRFIFLLCVGSCSLNAQIPRRIDSLIASAAKMKPDSMRVKEFIAVSRELILIGQLDTSLYYATAALDLSNKIKFDKGAALAYIKRAQATSYQGKYPIALDHFLRALRIATKINNRKIESDVLGNIGVIYDYQRDFPKALDYYQKCIRVKKELKDQASISILWGNIAIVLRQQGKLDSALYYHYKTLTFREGEEDPRDIGITQGNIATILLDLKRVKSADSILKLAVANLEKANDDRGLSIALISLANARVELNDLDGALKHAKKAYEIGERLKLDEQMEGASDILATIYSKKGMYREAYQFAVKNRVMRDTIYNINKDKDIVAKQMTYDFEKKQLADSLKQELTIQTEKKESEAKLSRQRMIAWFGIIGFALALVIVYILFRNNKEKQRTNVELTDKNSLIESQKREVELQKHIVEEKNHEILDSINYAKRIQNSLLANEQMLNQYLPQHFVFFRPKDIVSGDFYWAAKEGDKFFLAICDSTGHGVPGAFMSLLNIGFLSEAIKEKQILSPEKVFNYVRKRLVESISRDGQRDGFDGILVCFDLKDKAITYAAANNAPLLIDDGKATHLPIDKMPVGMGEKQQDFTLFTIERKPNSTIYFYTDGYADQFGGPKGKKFMYKKLNELLFSNKSLALPRQKEILGSAFENWKGELEQVDDVCVIGILM